MSSSKTTTANKDEVIVRFELSDGNCLKVATEFYKNLTDIVPFAFYKDRVVITRCNYEQTLMSETCFDKLDFVLDYYVNPALFNDPNHTRQEKRIIKVIENGITRYEEETVEVPDPRHIYIPVTDTFVQQNKNIARRDGFRMTIYKNHVADQATSNSSSSQSKPKSIQKGRRSNDWTPDSYMGVACISAGAAPIGEVKVLSQDIIEYNVYNLDFTPCDKTIVKQKIKLADLSSTCAKFHKQQNLEQALFMVYQHGFRIKDAAESNGSPGFGWGKYEDVKVNTGKLKIVIKDPNTENDAFGIPPVLLKGISKLPTMAGVNGVCAIRSNEISMEILCPVSSVGYHKITIILPPEDPNPSDDENDDDDDDVKD